MSGIIIISIFLFLLIPEESLAWGPLTHIYLANELLYLSPLIPPSVYALLRKYRKDFLYGNIVADIIFAKGLLPEEKNPHNWNVAFHMLEKAKRPSEKAFVYGYLCHLASDTVAHEDFVDSININHTIMELRADRLIEPKYWLQAITIGKDIEKRNDHLLMSSVNSAIFSFKTNKKLFKGLIYLSILNRKIPKIFKIDIIDNTFFPSPQWKEELKNLHEESLDRMLDILLNGFDSKVTKKNPFLII